MDIINIPNVELGMYDCLMKDYNSFDRDKHINSHGFMITDEDLMLTIYIMRCVYQNNDASNGGTGLYIYRREKNFFISKCKFNDATYNAKSDENSANLQALNSSSAKLSNCKFDFEKTNKALYVRFNILDRIMMFGCCFSAIGKGVENT